MAVAFLAALFASTHPDGLDFVAEKFGFAGKGLERTAPLANYTVSFLPGSGLATALAGIAGVIIILGIFWLAAYLIKREDLKHHKTAILLLAFLFAASPSFAGRPLVTDDYGTVNPGSYEFEFGYNTLALQSGNNLTNGLLAQFKRGFTPNFDFAVEVPYASSSPTGIGDAVLHGKLKILDYGENNGFTGRLDVKIANGDINQRLGTGYVDYAVLLIYSKTFGDFRTHYNLGYIAVGTTPGTSPINAINYSAAVEKEVATSVDLVGEYYAISLANGPMGNFQVGGRWLATSHLHLDAGYSFAVNEFSYNRATAGLTVLL